MIKMVTKRKKTVEELLESADSINKSIDFWEKQIKHCLGLIDKKSSPKAKLKLMKQLESLIAKGRLEIKNIDKWEKEKESFYAKNEK